MKTAKVTLLPSLVSISPIQKRLKYEKVTDTDNRRKVIAIACVDLWSRCAYEIWNVKQDITITIITTTNNKLYTMYIHSQNFGTKNLSTYFKMNTEYPYFLTFEYNDNLQFLQFSVTSNFIKIATW